MRTTTSSIACVFSLLVPTLAGIACSELTTGDDTGKSDAGPQGDATTQRDAQTRNDAGNVLVVTELGTGTLGEDLHRYHMLKLERGSDDASYAVWFLPPGATPAAVVLRTRPYDAISWTGESIDVEYSQELGELSVEQMHEEAGIWLWHDIAVLDVFARFYSGGDIANDVNDIVLGLEFLAQQADVDPERIGILGYSWGGFESLYGAANAPVTATPRAGVAYYAPSDFHKWTQYVLSLPQLVDDVSQRQIWQNFFAPYLDRVYASTGGTPNSGDYSDWTTQALTNKLNTPFLLVHDQLDTLVPFALSVDLTTAAPQKMQLLSYRYNEPLDYNRADLTHGDLQTQGYDFGIHATFSFNYLLTRLATSTQTIYAVYEFPALTAFLNYLKNQQAQSAPLGYGLTGLVEFCDPRIIGIDADDTDSSFAFPRSGAEILAPLINATWCSNIAADNLAQTLAQGLPANGCE